MTWRYSRVGNTQALLQLGNGASWAGYVLGGSTGCFWLHLNAAADVPILSVICYRRASTLATCACRTMLDSATLKAVSAEWSQKLAVLR